MAEVFMSSYCRRYTDEFRAVAVKRVIERGFT
ncbi:transposase, partial [Xanthomonas hyacinthi DSM 19077]